MAGGYYWKERCGNDARRRRDVFTRSKTQDKTKTETKTGTFYLAKNRNFPPMRR